MPKTATVTELEHHMESLQMKDQLKLLERMVRHLKRSLTVKNPAKVRKTDSAEYSPVRGALKQYANPALRERESAAFAKSIQAKHADH